MSLRSNVLVGMTTGTTIAHMAEQDRKRDRKKEEFDTYLTWSFIVVCWITTIFMVFMKLYA